MCKIVRCYCAASCKHIKAILSSLSLMLSSSSNHTVITASIIVQMILNQLKHTPRLSDCRTSPVSVILVYADSHSFSNLVTHQVSAVCSWDSSIHDSVHLNRITSPNERIYLIIKATVQLSHPASMELVLRKRIAVNIYNKQVSTCRYG